LKSLHNFQDNFKQPDISCAVGRLEVGKVKADVLATRVMIIIMIFYSLQYFTKELSTDGLKINNNNNNNAITDMDTRVNLVVVLVCDVITNAAKSRCKNWGIFDLRLR